MDLHVDINMVACRKSLQCYSLVAEFYDSFEDYDNTEGVLVPEDKY